jgi:multiple sugar transport system ATP-binding protein
MSMKELAGTHLTKVFDDGTRALDGVSFTARAGRVLTLLGPSGCGKSTLLRIVAGLEQPTSGELRLDGARFDDLPAGKRGVGFVFQNYALYPHLSVAGNLALALEAQRVPRERIAERVRATAELLGLTDLLARRPGQLSGGQQQRVALGRALVREPRLYLMDEPLSNLDAMLRETMRAELKTLFARVGATVIYVTHDQTEAMSLSDDLAVMRAGRILQCGPPLEVHRRPADVFVATFVGSPRMSLWMGLREGPDLVCDGVRIPLPASLPPGGDVCVGIRPEDVEVSASPLDGGWPAQRRVVEPLGSQVLLTLAVGGEQARALAEPAEWPQTVWMRWPRAKMHWFDAERGTRWHEADLTEGRG